MIKTFVEYSFDSDTTSYPSSYDTTKINLGYLMKKATDENGRTYVSPYEPVFMRGFEIYNFWNNGVMSTIKYDQNIIWLFYANPPTSTGAKRFFLSEYNITGNSFNEIGSINVSLVDNTNHNIYGLNSTLDYHTGGTVSVSFSAVTGVGTSWLTDGVCSGNRIGFGSSNPNQITTWYEVLNVNSNTSLTIKRGVLSDGSVNSNFIIPSGTSYVIEDLRIIYSNYSDATVGRRGSYIVKGLRKEIFNSSITSIPAATTVDNQRATYRLMDNNTGSNNYIPNGFTVTDKISLTEQYGYSVTYVSAAAMSIQKFNIRAPLTGLTSSRSSAAFILTTGNQNHNGTNTFGYNPIIKTDNDNLFVTNATRISRIPVSAVTASSTNFIISQMIENPPGGTNTFPLTSTLDTSHYMPIANRFYINNQSNGRNYVTPYASGSSPFERVIHIADTIQQSTYLDFSFNNLTLHNAGSYFYSTYNSGISFISRTVSSSNNILYAVALEADKDYHTTTNAYIITPKIDTPSAVTYDKVYIYTTDKWNNDDRFVYPREIYETFFRVSGITNDTGGWTKISQNGSLSGITSNEIQFKFAFRTIGNYCVPTRIHSLSISYSANSTPTTTSFYEPSLEYTNLSSNIFAWRQRDSFQTNIPNLQLDIYNVSGNTLLLTDNVNTSANGVWEYTSDGITWNSWVSSADTVGNYIRYSASTLSASGLKIKPILYI